MASIRQFLSSLSPSRATKVRPQPEQDTEDSLEDNRAGPPTGRSSDILRLCLGFQRWRERRASLLTLRHELRDAIFHYVLGEDVGKVKNVAYGHVELQLDIGCALAYTCTSLRREFYDHVYRRLSNSLRVANRIMLIYPFKTDDWAETLAHGLCTSCEPSDYIQTLIGHFTTLKLCEGVPPPFEEDNLSMSTFLDVHVWCLKARIKPCRCIQQRTSPKRCVSECTQLRRKPTVMQRISSWTTPIPKSRTVSDPMRYEISSPLNPIPTQDPWTPKERPLDSAPEISMVDVLKYYHNTRSSTFSTTCGAPDHARFATVPESCRISFSSELLL